jgi:hypothetical protein
VIQALVSVGRQVLCDKRLDLKHLNQFREAFDIILSELSPPLRTGLSMTRIWNAFKSVDYSSLDVIDIIARLEGLADSFDVQAFSFSAPFDGLVRIRQLLQSNIRAAREGDIEELSLEVRSPF